MYIGAHMSIGKGFAAAVEQAQQIGGNTLQFFTRNPRGAAAKALSDQDIEAFKEKRTQYGFGPLVAHAPYILNLASPKDDLWELAIRVIQEDLTRMSLLGVEYLTLHPGSHVGTGPAAGVARIAEGLKRILEDESATIILLETMAGSGTEVGKTFEEIAQIIEGVERKERLGVCLDTCHLFGAGYDVKDNLAEVIQQFEKIIGLDKLKAVHLNDSLQPLGSHKDRHANIGEGLIGSEALKRVVRHSKLEHLPFILETPGGIERYKIEIALFKEL